MASSFKEFSLSNKILIILCAILFFGQAIAQVELGLGLGKPVLDVQNYLFGGYYFNLSVVLVVLIEFIVLALLLLLAALLLGKKFRRRVLQGAMAGLEISGRTKFQK